MDIEEIGLKMKKQEKKWFIFIPFPYYNIKLLAILYCKKIKEFLLCNLLLIFSPYFPSRTGYVTISFRHLKWLVTEK